MKELFVSLGCQVGVPKEQATQEWLISKSAFEEESFHGQDSRMNLFKGGADDMNWESQEVKDLLNGLSTSARLKKLKTLENYGMIIYMMEALKSKVDEFEDQRKHPKLFTITYPTADSRVAPTVTSRLLSGGALRSPTYCARCSIGVWKLQILIEVLHEEVATIEEAKDIIKLPLNDPLGSLRTYEMNLDVESKGKGIALKTEHLSSNATLYSEEEVMMLAQDFGKFLRRTGKASKTQGRFRTDNRDRKSSHKFKSEESTMRRKFDTGQKGKDI
ncbi:hypothetical protein M9H77_17316 [Catharanthus roseus]|uniref:Uncharacterized protein n=1 Tax=Catharanthus roseus TaxID=4058 RepID=A0ACC0B4M1_CATRO|nr:hypothetical protein M9H77_17316 [Catharanthus roseus]